MVEKVGGRFSGATFDGMTDCKDYHHNEFQGEDVMFGADFIFFDRSSSVELTQKALDRVWEKWQPTAASGRKLAKPEVTLNPYDPKFDAVPSSDPYISNAREQLSTLLYREMRTTPVGEYPGTSALANEVKNLVGVGGK